MLFPVSVKISVDWGEMDAFAHINNIHYFKYFEISRIKYFELTGIMQLKKETNIGPILAATSCSFKQPLSYPEEILVFAGVSSIGKTSFVLNYKIEKENKTLVAEGDSTIVIYDYNSQVNVTVPPDIINNIETLEKRKFK